MPFTQKIVFATSMNFQRKGQQGPTLDKIFGSNFKRIKVPVNVPRGFSRENISKSELVIDDTKKSKKK